MKNEREILKRMEHDALLRERLAWLQRAVANCERSIARNQQQLKALSDEDTEADVTLARLEQILSTDETWWGPFYTERGIHR